MSVEKYRNINHVRESQLHVFPEHSKFLERRLAGLKEGELQYLDELAGHVITLTGDNLETYANDYAWLCREQLDEELFFRRNGRYRLSTFRDAYEQVYSNKEYMTRYMNGLLMTQLWWSNHTAVMQYYRSEFLAKNADGYTHLEIGPGHGLFLYFAAADKRAGSVTGWDISEASIALTQEALLKLGLDSLPKLELQDFFKAPMERFDSVVFSEVLEHMENPVEALQFIRPLLTENGRLFLNMPINSPAPDHLFNMGSPAELQAFIERVGFLVESSSFLPATNQTLEMSLKKKMTVSCVFVLRKA
ncbi:MAG: class I SAM-dependent methyltransferase [Rhizobium sp.]|nr:class I SAM-dependent methyltransferase [Rhizobium sp.]